MSQKGPHIDPQLERHFGGFSPQPPEGAWERIAATLDRRQKRRAVWWWSSTAAALLITGALLWHFRAAHAPESQTAAVLRQSESAPTAVKPETGLSQTPKPAPKHETPFRLSESKQYTHPTKEPAPLSNVQTGAPDQEVVAVISVPLPHGFGMSGKGIETLSGKLAVVVRALPVYVEANIKHRHRVTAPALDLGLVLNPSLQGLQLRLASAWANYVHEDYLGIRRNQESPLQATQAGLELALRLRKGLRINSGLWYAEQGRRQDYHYDISKIPAYRGGTADLFGNKLIEGYFIDPTPEQVRYSGTSKMQFLHIPLQLGYEHCLGIRGGVQVQAGAAAAFLLGSNGVDINYSNLTLNNNSNAWMRDTRWSALGSLNYFRQLSPVLRVGAGFRLEQSLSNQYKSGAALIGKNGSRGIMFNLHYRIY